MTPNLNVDIIVNSLVLELVMLVLVSEVVKIALIIIFFQDG